MRGFLDDGALAAALRQARAFASPIRGSTGLNTKNVLALEHGKARACRKTYTERRADSSSSRLWVSGWINLILS